jgi:hypothetical protein
VLSRHRREREGIWERQRLGRFGVAFALVGTGDPMEGFVVRLADRFHYGEFRYNVAKWVRAEHKVRHGEQLRRNQVVGG